MAQTGFESRVKIQDVIKNHLPSYILDESPKTIDFLKQYYISQEYQGGPVDIVENLDQYLKVDNLTPEILVGETKLTSSIDIPDVDPQTGVEYPTSVINVSSTKGFPNSYGLLKINDEIITYTEKTPTSFLNCIRGFSGIENYHKTLDYGELVFSSTKSSSHASESVVYNLSSLFLKEFFEKIKYSYVPGFEGKKFDSNINVGNFIKNAKSFYLSKGTDESFRILFNVLYGENPKVVNLENYLIKPSDAEFIRSQIVIAEAISGDPLRLAGQSITKNTDPETYASVSKVEIFTRDGKKYFKLSLFVGYDEKSNIIGTFEITPSTKCLEKTEFNSQIISVDSTIGFGDYGTIFSGNNVITYSKKSVNQFLGCVWSNEVEPIIGEPINPSDLVRSDNTYYGYEDGDLNKKVELRLTGSISDFKQISDYVSVDEGQIISVSNIGELIANNNSSKKNVFANSWVYNTSCTVEIESIDGSRINLKNSVDKSQFKIGDRIEIIDAITKQILYPLPSTPNLPYINAESDLPYSLSISNFNVSGILDLNSPDSYAIRRKINRASSEIVPIKYGNDSIISDVQNVYVDGDEYAYVASNSLPSNDSTNTGYYTYQITKGLNKSILSENNGSLTDEVLDNTLYKTSIQFDDVVPFVTGDEIFYQPESAPLVGLTTGKYFVRVLNSKKIELYTSKSHLNDLSNVIELSEPSSGFGVHTFTLNSQKSNVLDPKRIFKKFPLSPINSKETKEETSFGSIGMLINGVEIFNYKIKDKIYYGPIQNISVLNGGSNYDVINPPKIEISAGLGVTALANAVVTGSIKEVLVDPQDFDISSIVSIDIEGGNGSEASFSPILKKRRREVIFDGRSNTNGGNVFTSTNQIVFDDNHNFINGDEVVYNNNGNPSIPIGLGSSTLVDKSVYYVSVDNSKTIQLHTDKNLTSAINFYSAASNGDHKFLVGKEKTTLYGIKVVNSGSFTNRNLLVKSENISSDKHLITFKNHGFSNGELVKYFPLDGLGSIISGLTTTNTYRILKIDDDSFRVCNSGIGGTSLTDFESGNFVKFSSSGSGYQQFKYPDISLNVKYISNESLEKNLVVTPVIKGSIEDILLYERGSGYGSDVLNLEKLPNIKAISGASQSISRAIISISINNGSITNANVSFGGFEYFSTPDLEVIDPTGSGSGAKLRAIVENGVITDVVIIDSGLNYSTSTVVSVVNSGSGAILSSNIRSLDVNYVNKLTSSSPNNYQYENFEDYENNLQYSISGYFQKCREAFQENPSKLSGIIGWAYDGNPILGPYHISNPNNLNSPLKTIKSSYIIDSSNILDRPSTDTFPLGYFVDDYKYDSSEGDLDENNGRYTKTLEFPNGIYAYHATLDDLSRPEFPYFIGKTFKSTTLKENSTLNQNFDFNSSNLVRNTLPYKISELFSDNDFIIETNEIDRQKIEITSTSKGSIESIKILNPGNNYKIGDTLTFDNTGTNGDGLNVKVSSISGKFISSVSTTVDSYENIILTRKNSEELYVNVLPYHEFKSGDRVTLSGLSTNRLSNINGNYIINVESIREVGLYTTIPSSGITTEIYLDQIPQRVSVGMTAEIGSEKLEILNIYREKNILRVRRTNSGLIHPVGTAVTFKQDRFTIKSKTDYFDSKLNDKIYFNPNESIGVGVETGTSYDVSFSFGQQTVNRSILTQTIYVENHPFYTNQEISFNLNGNGNIQYRETSGGPSSNLPSTLYVVKKSPNTFSLKTSLNGNEIFFTSNGDNSDTYYFESKFKKQIGKIESIIATVSTSSTHGLLYNDTVDLVVRPNLSVGIGTSTAIRVERISGSNFIKFNSVEFTSSEINISDNEISLVGNNLKTGDKIYYESSNPAVGLENGSYFVFKVDSDTIKLCNTYFDSTQNPPIAIDITGSGGLSHFISQINPEVTVVNNNNVVFDLSDSSLLGYNFRIYEDNNFIHEFKSTLETSDFNVSTLGTPGNANSSLTITYDSKIPESLYYALDDGNIVFDADKEVKSYSRITYVDSTYTDTYNIFNVGASSFDISLKKIPENLSYSSANCDILEYHTTSISAKGPVKKLSIKNNGQNYKKIPFFTGSNSSDGENLNVLAESTSVGNILNVKTINKNFEYSSDLTLKPKAYISPNISIKDSNFISEAFVEYGGSGYSEAPDIVVVNNSTGLLIDNGIIEASITEGSISELLIKESPKGVSDQSGTLYAVNNTNGVVIEGVISNNTGIFTCILQTPDLGNDEDLFALNEEVFIEGIQKDSGTGFNSSDYGYQFFKVTQYENAQTTPGITRDRVTISAEEFTSDTGTASLIQSSSGTIISKNNYPIFGVTTLKSDFEIGEGLRISRGNTRFLVDLVILGYDKNSLKVFGSFTDLRVNDLLEGTASGNVATISAIEYYEGNYDVNYSVKLEEGWKTDIGKLNLDTQVVADNDYYQNLSYSVKSSLPWSEIKTPINSLVHTAGMKNFCETEILLSYKNRSRVKTILVELSPTTTTVDAFSGDSTIFVENTQDYSVGDTVIINSGSQNEQTTTIKAINSETNQIQLEDTLTNNVSSGTSISVETQRQVPDVPPQDVIDQVEDTEKPITNIEQEISSVDVTLGIFGESRTETINDLDFAKDFDLVDGKSRFLKFKNIKLSDFNTVNTNRVLKIDNINDEFLSEDAELVLHTDIEQLLSNNSYSDYLIKVSSNDNPYIQLSSIKVLNKGSLFLIAENESLVNSGIGSAHVDGELLGDFSIEYNDLETKEFLRFTPKDPYNVDYNIKYLKKTILNAIGVGTLSLNVANITNASKIVTIGQNENIISVPTNNFNSLHVVAHLTQQGTLDSNFVELYLTHDGNNTYISQYDFDGQEESFSSNGIGSFTSDINSGILSLNYQNNSVNDIIVKTRVVGFGTTGSIGINSTYRFLSTGQPSGSERSFIYQSNYSNSVSGASTSIFSLDKNLFDSSKSLIQVSIGQSKALHQVSLLQDGSDIYIHQSPFLSVGNNETFDNISGIGTFGGVYNGSNFELIFYPDSNYDVEIVSLTEGIYAEVDTTNSYNALVIGNEVDLVGTKRYFSVNGPNINKKDFVLKSNGTPIFAKTFDPSNSDDLDITTGKFTIKDHFFSENEELIYEPDSSFIGVSPSPITYSGGDLPSTVYVVNRQGDDEFYISDVKNGSPLTFTSTGSGNIHRFIMAKRNEKCLITIDNIAQTPISYAKISTVLDGNGGGITTTSTIFSLNDISSINTLDILKIDDEYMEVINVGIGTSNIGPITNNGSEFLVEVERGFIGSSSTSHVDTTNVYVYRGSYDIVKDKIFFTESPRGNSVVERNESNLVYQTSDFSGRVFLRTDYTTNQVFDDISNEFTGIGRTFTLTVGGANTTGIGQSGGNGIVFINGIFQSPNADNNPNNNYQILDDNVGITTIVFTGINTDPGYPPLVNESDINQNQIPRGGLIVSLGSTGGLGVAPPVGASVTAVISGGVIQNSVGLGSTDFLGSGYNGLISIAVTAYDPTGSGSGAIIEATSNVGAGGSLSFNVINGGNNYSDQTRIFVSEPSYDKLEVIGVSRVGLGSTTTTGVGLLMNIEVGPSSKPGVGSTYFEVKNFNIIRSGYSFKKGDVFKPVGLVTDHRLSSLIEDFELTVLETFTDKFAAWQFGELDYIDSIKDYQDGSRVLFPIYYNGNLLSFEKEEGSEVDLQNSLLIIINGIIQEPGVSYTFDGGTAFAFAEPPKKDDNIAIFFYRGTKNLDDEFVTNIPPTIKEGDIVQSISIDQSISQNPRTVYSLYSSDTIETNLYNKQGIDDQNYKLVRWTKQKSDKLLGANFVTKSRPNLLSQVYPTAKVIKDILPGDTEIFVDNLELFTYDLTASLSSPSYDFSAILVSGDPDPVAADLTAIVSGGAVSGITINDGGSGYTGSTVDLKFTKSSTGDVATATLTVDSDGSLTTPLNIIDGGSGYTSAPYVIAPVPSPIHEDIPEIGEAQGFSGNVTQIESFNNGGQLALRFTLSAPNFTNLNSGYRIVISDTHVGSGVTSVISNDTNPIGTGTTCFDNVYHIDSISSGGSTATIVCNIDNSSDVSDLPIVGTASTPVGRFSWGRFYNITRFSTPVSISIDPIQFDNELSLFPTIQRRSDGIRNNGSIFKPD